MLKRRDLIEVPELFELLSHPEVYPYVRDRAKTYNEYLFLTMKTIEDEHHHRVVSRTILDEFLQPIGTINLFDRDENYGFLATWIGKPFFGKGFNQEAKALFFEELFFTIGIETIFVKVRRTNLRSLKAIAKLTYVTNGKRAYPDVYNQINKQNNVYELFAISKEHYVSYLQFANLPAIATNIEGESVS